MNQGCRVQIYAKNPNLLFYTFEGDTISIKEELEKICDDWVEELGKSIHTQFTLPMWSFTTKEIYLTREYSF